MYAYMYVILFTPFRDSYRNYWRGGGTFWETCKTDGMQSKLGAKKIASYLEIGF